MRPVCGSLWIHTGVARSLTVSKVRTVCSFRLVPMADRDAVLMLLHIDEITLKSAIISTQIFSKDAIHLLLPMSLWLATNCLHWFSHSRILVKAYKRILQSKLAMLYRWWISVESQLIRMHVRNCPGSSHLGKKRKALTSCMSCNPWVWKYESFPGSMCHNWI